MNILKRIYCRAFQFCFHVAIPFLPYKKPISIKAIKDMPDVMKKEGIDSVLLITDSSIRSFGITKNLEELLPASGIKLTVYDKTVANPTDENVEEARQIYIDNKCNGLIGFGGGSSIDCAKAVGARIVNPNMSLDKMGGILKIWAKLPPLFAIPTTAGTGSETTLASVIVNAKTRHKYAINSFPLIPKYAVLDPEVTRTLPPSLTAATGMDALTHAVEAYIGGSTTRETRHDARLAVKLIFANIREAYNNGNNMKARRSMLYASFLAGNAFTRSYVGYVHAVAHTLGGQYNIPHGVANATLLPFVLEEYGEAAYCKLHELAIVAGISTKNESAEEGALKFIQAIKDMKKDLGIGDTFKEIKKGDIPKLARYADKEGNPLYPVPVLMNAKELERFYYMLMEVEE